MMVNQKKVPSVIKEEKLVVSDTTQKTKIEEKDEYNIAVIKDFYGKVDPWHLGKELHKRDPHYTFRFLRDDQKNLSIKTSNILFQKGGWQLCMRAYLLKKEFKNIIKLRQISPDGFLRVGDTILSRMPTALYNEKRKYKDKEANARIGAVKRNVDMKDSTGKVTKAKEGIPGIGGKEMHPSMHGIQTKEQLGM